MQNVWLKSKFDDDLIGRRVRITLAGTGNQENATVVAVHKKHNVIKVRLGDGKIMVGNQWEEIDGD